MRDLKDKSWLPIVFSIALALLLFSGCDSGEKTIDGLTGDQAVKQYHETKKDIDDMVDKQNERWDGLDEAEEEDEALIFEEDGE